MECHFRATCIKHLGSQISPNNLAFDTNLGWRDRLSWRCGELSQGYASGTLGRSRDRL
ncbi:MAG: hypothetical protein ICV61_18840 [Microcoleus sp. Co-bin12]|nr:hypothetical protein [Microcoleus sp. Co-bin12]